MNLTDTQIATAGMAVLASVSYPHYMRLIRNIYGQKISAQDPGFHVTQNEWKEYVTIFPESIRIQGVNIEIYPAMKMAQKLFEVIYATQLTVWDRMEVFPDMSGQMNQTTIEAYKTSYAQSSENLEKIKTIMSEGEISANGRRIVYELDNTTRINFGLDIGENAHPLRNQGYLEHTNHMNIEIQKISESGKVYTKWDIHLILDENNKVIDQVITGPWKDK